MRAASSVSVLLAIAISGRAGAGYDAARGGAEREQVASGAVPPAPARLQVSFRLDPRLTRGLYMGDRWVSPPMYSKVQDGKDLVVEARVHGLTARGAVPVHATWRSADPEIATVSSPEGNGVTLRILREGHTHVEVAYGGVSSRLAVEADLHRGLLRVNITPEAAKAALAPEAASPSLRSRSGTQKPESWKERAERNKKAGRAFLAANRIKKGVVTLPSGLQYRILRAGKGPKPTLADTVVVHYRGALVDGTEVDGSIGRGEPVPLALARTILGWRQALVRMPVGSRWELVVPPRLAYGRRAVGPKIGPYATLVFEIELLSIRPKEPSEGKLTRVATPERRDGATVSTP